MNAYKLISAVFEIKELVEEESTDGNICTKCTRATASARQVFCPRTGNVIHNFRRSIATA